MRNSTRIAAAAASATLAAAAMVAPAAAAPSQPSIFDIVEGSGDHNILEFALETTGLDSTLDGKRQFTLFAPTDAAFGALPEGALAGLISPEEAAKGYPALTSILLYHVAPGERFSGDVVSSSKIRTMSKQFAAVEGTTVGGASLNLGAIDLDASNGVVHVLDEVMLP
jgi:uncharacterized surface protein with fasciclin (FAS1) repeats